MSAQQEVGRARREALGGASVLVLLATLCVSTPALAAKVLTPSAAQRLPALVDGTKLPAGAAFSSISVRGSRATLVLTGGSPPAKLGSLELTPASGPVSATRSRSFDIEIHVAKDTPEVHAALKAARARIVAQDPGGLYTRAGSSENEGAPHAGPAPAPPPAQSPARRRASWLSRSLAAFALLAVASVWALRRSARP